MSTDEFALSDAAYVLGALSPSDRRAFEEHLKVCAACASSVGELAGLPGLMSKVSEDQLNAHVEPPPATLLPSLARAVRRERGRRRLYVGTAAAAAALLIAVGASVITRPVPPARPPVAAPCCAPSGLAHQGLRGHQVGRAQGGGCHRLVGAGGGDHDLALGRLVGIADIDLQQKAVELGLGQRVGAFRPGGIWVRRGRELEFDAPRLD